MEIYSFYSKIEIGGKRMEAYSFYLSVENGG